MANGISLFDYSSFKEFDDSDLSKMELHDVINYSKSKYEVNSTINFPRMDLRASTDDLTEEENEIRNSYLNEVKKNIMENGGAYVGTYMNSSCQYTDTNLNNLVIDVYNCSVTGGHAMQIVGWDDDLEYSYCADTKSHNADTSSCNRVVSGKGVWILKNSWGNNTQYPYLTYDSLYNSIHFIDEMISTDNKTWDNNYVLGEGVEYIKEKTYNLSDTKLKGLEKLKKVKFITENSDTVYNVKVYKSDGSNESFSYRNELPGLITVDIPGDVTIDSDSKIIVTSENGYYIDKVSIFISNIDLSPYIDLTLYDNISINEGKIRLYSETKNIPSGTELIYKFYDSNNQEITDKFTYSNNIVAENNINTLITYSNDLDGNYRIDVIYNSNVISSVNVEIIKMKGTGTEDDPYIITNSAQLNKIRDDLGAYYELANDIDLTEDTREGGKLSLESKACPQGFGWESINGFTGTLDGKGYTIKGLYQNNFLTCNEDQTTWYEWNNAGNGLFGSAYGNVTIKNLVLEDFDVNCQGSYCSALLSRYRDNNGDYNDDNEYTATFKNIVLRNSEVSGIYNIRNGNSSLEHSYGGGLFGSFVSLNGNISVSNIYLDFELEPDGLEENAYLLNDIQGNNVDINNIQVKGNINGKYDSGSEDSVLIHRITGALSTKNILSTVTGTNVGGNLLGTVWGSGEHVTINSVNLLKFPGKELFYRFDNKDNATIINTNVYDKDTELSKLTDKNNYSTWEDFDDNWVIKTVDGVPRIPVLKIVDFEYTSIPDISISQKLNEHKSIYDYIEPNIDSAKRISYKSNNEDIVKIDENGIIIPQSTGSTTIHIESYYDGYIKDVPISIEYEPHYTIHFDSNDTEDYYSDIEGVMNSIEVEAGKPFTLPSNKFKQDYFEFKEWNTKPDGTGTSYSDLSEIPAMSDKEEITLYVQWIGEERVITFNPNGGTVSPDKKIVRIGSEYGAVPIPNKPGYGFNYWVSKGSILIVLNIFTSHNDLEYTASWTEDAYTIIYDANGGTVDKSLVDSYKVYIVSDTLATTSAKNGSEKSIYKNIFKKDGYEFKEWNTKPDGTGTSYAVDETIQLSNVLNDTFRLYAVWEITEFKLEFDSNGGIGEMNNQIFNYDVSQKITKNSYTREGYKFKEWNTKPDGTGISYTDEKEIKLSENLKLYAIWEETYSYIINKYSLDDNNKYIDKIDINTTVDEYKKNIDLNVEYSIDVDHKTVEGKDLLYTGGKTKIYKNNNLFVEYTNIIRGEVTGDGKINYLDYVNVYNHIQKIKHPESTKKELKNEYLISADISGDGKVNYLDYVKIYNKIKELKGVN